MWEAAIKVYGSSGRWPATMSSQDTRRILKTLSEGGQTREAVSLLSHPGRFGFDSAAWDALTRTCTPHLTGDQAVAMLVTNPVPTTQAMATSVLTRLVKPDVEAHEQWRLALRLNEKLLGVQFKPDERYNAVLTRLLSNSLLSSTGQSPSTAESIVPFSTTLSEPHLRWLDFLQRNKKALAAGGDLTSRKHRRRPISSNRRKGKWSRHCDIDERKVSSASGDDEQHFPVWEEALELAASIPERTPLLPQLVSVLAHFGQWNAALQFLLDNHAHMARTSIHARDIAALADQWEMALSLHCGTHQRVPAPPPPPPTGIGTSPTRKHLPTDSKEAKAKAKGRSDSVKALRLPALSKELLECLGRAGQTSLAAALLEHAEAPTTAMSSTGNVSVGGSSERAFLASPNAVQLEQCSAKLILSATSWSDALRLASASQLFALQSSATGKVPPLRGRARARSVQLLMAAGKTHVLRDWARAHTAQLQPPRAVLSGDQQPPTRVPLMKPLLRLASCSSYRLIFRELKGLRDFVGLEFLAEMTREDLQYTQELYYRLQQHQEEESGTASLAAEQRYRTKRRFNLFLRIEELSELDCAITELLYFGYAQQASSSSSVASEVLAPAQVEVLQRSARLRCPIAEAVKEDAAQHVENAVATTGATHSSVWAGLGLSPEHFLPDLTRTSWLSHRYQILKELCFANAPEHSAHQQLLLDNHEGLTSLLCMSVICGDFHDCFEKLTAAGVQPRQLLLEYLHLPGKHSPSTPTMAAAEQGHVCPPRSFVAVSILATKPQDRAALREILGGEAIQAAVELAHSLPPSIAVRAFRRLSFSPFDSQATPTKKALTRAWNSWFYRTVVSRLTKQDPLAGVSSYSARRRRDQEAANEQGMKPLTGADVLALLERSGCCRLAKNHRCVDAGVRFCLDKPQSNWCKALAIVHGANGRAEVTSQLLAMECAQRAEVVIPNAIFKKFHFHGLTAKDRRWWLDFASSISCILQHCPTTFEGEEGLAASTANEESRKDTATREERTKVVSEHSDGDANGDGDVTALACQQCEALHRLIQHSPPALVAVIMRGISLLSPDRRYLLISAISLCGSGPSAVGALGENPHISVERSEWLLQAEGYRGLASQSARSAGPSCGTASASRDPTVRFD